MKQVAQTEMTGHNRDRVMSNEINSGREKAQPLVYQIRIKGHLGCEWTDWFGGLTLTLEDNGDTLLTGPVVDQAALHGLLRKVRDLGVPLLSVNRVKPGEAEASEVNETHHSRSKKGDTNESNCFSKT
jgi:hypothetical protein